MSFRRSKSTRHAEHREWRRWLAPYESTLRDVGLPPGVTMSEAHWIDFVQNGYLERHPESNDGFMFDQLSPGTR